MGVAEEFTEKLRMRSEGYISQLGIAIADTCTALWGSGNAEYYTVALKIKGDMEGYILLNFEASLAYSLVNHYILDAVDEKEISNYADKVAAEIANIVAGMTLNDYDEAVLYLGVPAVYLSSELGLKTELTTEPVLSSLTENGLFQCLYIGSDEIWQEF